MEVTMEEYYELTKQEIGNAIVRYIGIYKNDSHFFPFRIVEAIPNESKGTVLYKLEYVPRGTKSNSEEAKHAL
jgi:hypothetical protein